MNKKRPKPAKPYPNFPLFAHSNGQWAKKIRGKLFYFGPWNDHESSLKKFLAEKDHLFAGMPVPAALSTGVGGVSLGELAEGFLEYKLPLVAESTYGNYLDGSKKLCQYFGSDRPAASLNPLELSQYKSKLVQKYGTARVGMLVRIARMLLTWGYEMEHLEKPIRFGPGFKEPTKVEKRRERASKPKAWFEVEELRLLLDTAAEPLRTWMLLGLNCGYEPHDLAGLEPRMIDWKRGMIDYPRPKTGIERRCILWTETAAGLKQAIKNRPEPADPKYDKFALLTRRGYPISRTSRNTAITTLTKHCVRCGLTRPDDPKKKLPGKTWLALRHVCETIGGSCRDQVAVDCHMGHADGSMAAVYREGLHDGDERLKAVSDVIRHWLWPDQ